MINITKFKSGDILFREGDATDRVMRIRAGEVEVLRQVGSISVLLGHARAGEWLGEMAVFEDRFHSATACATADGEVEVLSAHEFLELVTNDSKLARDLIQRLCVRLKNVDDKLARNIHPSTHDWVGTIVGGMPPEGAIAEDAHITLSAETEALRSRIGAAAIHIAELPFVVGRRSRRHEAASSTPPDLLIEDDEPFRLSRQHFMIGRSGQRLVLHDLGSTLGTILNGTSIGSDFSKDAAPLRRGENHVIAGGRGSPFCFLLSVDYS
jgi:CRP-like cAMP-binding protein